MKLARNLGVLILCALLVAAMWLGTVPAKAEHYDGQETTQLRTALPQEDALESR